MSVFSLDIKAGTGVGTAGAQFLKIGPGARVDGIGSAFCAIADDVTAVYWNPAGIGQLEGFNLSDTHTYWIADTRFKLTLTFSHQFLLSFSDASTSSSLLAYHLPRSGFVSSNFL